MFLAALHTDNHIGFYSFYHNTLPLNNSVSKRGIKCFSKDMRYGGALAGGNATDRLFAY
jgi:hypothetical protein